MYAFLCNAEGETMCGTDTVCRVDGRFTTENKVQQASQYRARFKKHFPHKYNYWTHVFFARTIRDAKPNKLYRLLDTAE